MGGGRDLVRRRQRQRSGWLTLAGAVAPGAPDTLTGSEVAQALPAILSYGD